MLHVYSTTEATELGESYVRLSVPQDQTQKLQGAVCEMWDGESVVLVRG